jgi:hypothetical protein
MTKRLPLEGCLFLLAAIGLVREFKPRTALAATTVVALQPIRSFQIQGVDGLRLNDIETYNRDLFLLLSDGSGSDQILRIKGSGDLLQKIRLPSLPRRQQVRRLRISQSGTLAVSYFHLSPSPLTRVLLFDTDGTLRASFDTRFFNEIAFMGDDLVGVEPSGITQLTAQSQFVSDRRIPLDVIDRSGKVWTASLPQNKLAIVEPVSARLQIAGMKSVLVGPMALNAPEIQEVERPQQPDSQILTAMVHTVAASPAGDLYLGITGAKRQEGVPVLQFDSSGMLKNRIKCILPTFGQDPSDHQSYMYSGKLLATNDSLFWVSMSEKKVAEYSIADLH